MNRIPHIPLLLALGSCVALAEEPALQVAVNRTEIFLGESLIMEVGVTGSASSEDPDLSALSSCHIRPRGSHSSRQMSFSFTNGRVQRSESVTRISVYEITPSAAGVFRAGPIRVNVGGRQLRDEGPTISVVGIEQQKSRRPGTRFSWTSPLISRSASGSDRRPVRTPAWNPLTRRLHRP
jgi:hypothetical protein